jgi:hypothetical protein
MWELSVVELGESRQFQKTRADFHSNLGSVVRVLASLCQSVSGNLRGALQKAHNEAPRCRFNKTICAQKYV